MKAFFDNASFAAFIGAAAAFFLVVLNDRRRDRRAAKKILPALLKRLRVLTESRRKNTAKAEKSLDQPLRVRDIGLHFPIARIQQYADQSIEHLSGRQAMALESLTFRMGECDRLNAVSLELMDQINVANSDITRGEASQRLQVPSLIKRLREHYNEQMHLLTTIDEFIVAYLEGTLNERGGPTVTTSHDSDSQK